MMRLKNLREQKGVSQQIVADYLEISRQAYSNYENENREPDLKMIRRIANYFGVSIDYLLGMEKKEQDTSTQNTGITKLTPEEIKIIRAYQVADERARIIVDAALEPFTTSTVDNQM